jgi:hypothetical protein
MTSTFSWMMAMAIDELRPLGGPPVDGEIAIYGVDMEYGTEYAQQRAGFRHFLEVARILGITITRLNSTGLAYDPVPYPMWQDDPLLNKLELRQSLSRRKLDEMDVTIRHTRTMIAQNRAVIEALRKYNANSEQTTAEIVRLEKELDDLMQCSAGISKDIVHWTAVNEEQDWLHGYLQA